MDLDLSEIGKVGMIYESNLEEERKWKDYSSSLRIFIEGFDSNEKT